MTNITTLKTDAQKGIDLIKTKEYSTKGLLRQLATVYDDLIGSFLVLVRETQFGRTDSASLLLKELEYDEKEETARYRLKQSLGAAIDQMYGDYAKDVEDLISRSRYFHESLAIVELLEDQKSEITNLQKAKAVEEHTDSMKNFFKKVVNGAVKAGYFVYDKTIRPAYDFILRTLGRETGIKHETQDEKEVSEDVVDEVMNIVLAVAPTGIPSPYK